MPDRPLTPPEILIFFHIAKVGGTTMDAILKRAFPGAQHFDGATPMNASALSLRSSDVIASMYRALPEADRRAVRCVMGTLYPMNIHTVLDRPAKYFGMIRPPVERTASHFFHYRVAPMLAMYERVKDMTLDEYLDSGITIDQYDYQVRILSGAPELDVPWDPAGGRISAPPVERRHLEMAKRNIEEHFIALAPLHEFTKLLMWLRALYGWNLWQLLYVPHNLGTERRTDPIAPATRRRLEEMNRYDMELYEWAKARWDAQTRPMERELAQDSRRFEMLNNAAQSVRRKTPASVARLVSKLLAPRHSA